MKYFVIVTRWSEEQHAQIKEIAGMFDRWHLAMMFKKAYDTTYSTNASIIESSALINA